MRYIFLAIASISLLLVSCKKSDVETPPNTIIATINGKTIKFDAARGTYGFSSVINNYDLNLASDIFYPKNIAVRLTNPTPIVAGSYTSAGRIYPVSLYIFYDGLISDPVKESFVTVTSINAYNVKGTFSGQLWTGTGTTDSIIITNGSFNIDF